ncbi:multiple epidermal growth factor-like domains protein 10 isoform X2 [Stegodyphus dumicola]|uniref:multiple epidermal growth factor-like domains protein 10 isoform X2 n=1 Tax=Stegodyphus dumicola TaxID=202533 RepID=UPI0015A849B1|nr:multiple epidermal growth factor-like domains protein 10 isoform X2 [Stegodyphus dumicola]
MRKVFVIMDAKPVGQELLVKQFLTECPPGTFGRNCASICHCHENSTTPCDKKTGFCDGLCEEGYTGQNCQKQCLPNTYGVNCRETCNCYNGGQCNRVDGSCTCVGFFTGLYCNESQPQIIPAKDDIRIIQGGQVLISCTAHAIPGPLISIVSREFPDLNVQIKLFELYEHQAVANVTLRTSGTFEFLCTAQNLHGFDMKNMTIIVIL